MRSDDIVLAHAKKTEDGSSTGEALEFLNLPHVPENYCAANTYLMALAVIRKLQAELKDLQRDIVHSNPF